MPRRNRAPVPTQSTSQHSQLHSQLHSQNHSQLTFNPVMDSRKLQNIWTMRPLGGTGGALKALAKNVAQHMNLNRSTLKRVVAQVVAEHHNLGQVDDYKGHMYYAKPERLNFLNLLAQSKEALDDLLLMDPRLAKKFHRKEQVKKAQRVSSQGKISSRYKGVPSKGLAAASVSASGAPGKGHSSMRLATSQERKSSPKMIQTLKKMPLKVPVKISVKIPMKVLGKGLVQAPSNALVKSPSKTRVKFPSTTRVKSVAMAPAKSQSKTLAKSLSNVRVKTPGKALVKTPAKALGKSPSKTAVKSPSKTQAKTLAKTIVKPPAKTTNQQQQLVKDVKLEDRMAFGSRSPFRSGSALAKSSRVQYSGASQQRLPAGSTRRMAGSAQKPPAVWDNSLTKSKPKMKVETKVKTAPKLKQGKAASKPSQRKQAKREQQQDQQQAAEIESEAGHNHQHRSRSQSPKRQRNAHCPLPSPTPTPTPTPSTVTANMVLNRHSRRQRGQATAATEGGLTAKTLTKALTKALAKAFPKEAKSQSDQEKPTRSPTPTYRNYDKPWLVSRAKPRRRLVAGCLEKIEKTQKKQEKQEKKQQQKQQELVRMSPPPPPRRKPQPRSHESQQMRHVDFPWYTPYQFQGGAGATQPPSPRSSSPPLLTTRMKAKLSTRQRQQRALAERLRREGAIDTMLNYGSGLFRRHRGEWMPARRSSSQLLARERRRLNARRSSPSHKTNTTNNTSPTAIAKRKSSSLLKRSRGKKDKKGKQGKQAKPLPEGGTTHLPPPPPSAVSSDDPAHTQRKAKTVDSSLGSYADLFQASDSHEALRRSKRRLSIAFNNRPSRSSFRRRRQAPVWK